MTEQTEVLAHLRAVAEAATPGPWRIFRVDRGRWNVMADEPDNSINEATGEHIATFDPPTVLKLLAVAAQTVELCNAIEEYFLPEPPSEHFFEDLAVARAALDALTEESALRPHVRALIEDTLGGLATEPFTEPRGGLEFIEPPSLTEEGE